MPISPCRRPGIIRPSPCCCRTCARPSCPFRAVHRSAPWPRACAAPIRPARTPAARHRRSLPGSARTHRRPLALSCTLFCPQGASPHLDILLVNAGKEARLPPVPAERRSLGRTPSRPLPAPDEGAMARLATSTGNAPVAAKRRAPLCPAAPGPDADPGPVRDLAPGCCSPCCLWRCWLASVRTGWRCHRGEPASVPPVGSLRLLAGSAGLERLPAGAL